MISAQNAVEEVVRESPFLEEALANQLINLSSLARKIQPQVARRSKKQVKLGAIVMALKRTASHQQKRQNLLAKIISEIGDLTVRSNLIEFTLLNSETLIDKEKKLLHSFVGSGDVFCNFSKGVGETTIIVSKSIAEMLQKLFHGERLLSTYPNLSSITIKLPAENVKVAGIYYMILKQLAWENINIIEAFSTSNELTLFFADGEIERAFAVLKRLKGRG